MKILIKTHSATYLKDMRGLGNHISGYWNFLQYDCFKQLGHEVMFYGQRAIPDFVTDKHEGYDVLLCRGYNSLRSGETDFITRGLKTFKGKKILYLEGTDENNLGQYFDVVIVPETPVIAQEWRVKYPNKNIKMLPWTSLMFDFIDKDTNNPYPNDGKYRSIFTGILIKRFLDGFIELAKRGENIVLGGLYYDGKTCRGFTGEEMKALPPTIQIINPHRGGIFTLGEHFPYLKHADLGLSPREHSGEWADRGSLSAKLIEYLCCGLPVVCEDATSNRQRVTEYNAGTIVPWKNVNAMYEAIQKEKALRRNKQEIQTKARAVHDPLKISKEMLEC